MKHVKTGALIAIAAGSLFAAACEKKQDKPADKTDKTDKPAKKEPTKTKADPTVKDDPAGKDDPADKDEADKPNPAGSVAAEKPTEAPAEKVSSIDCGGVNACKGQGTCASETHGCGGQNECKGQGVLSMTEEECKEKGGTVTASKM